MFNVVPVNDSPSVSLTNLVNSVDENSTFTNSIRVAEIVIDDDNSGVNELLLSGADASNFEIVGNELRLLAGMTLDFEGDSELDVTVGVDDSSIGLTSESSVDFTLDVLDVNESPTISLANVVQAFPVGTDLAAGVRVADIVVSDDALGTETLQIVGPDAHLFEIVGNELRFNSSTGIDFSNNTQSVSVQVDDASLGQTFDDSVLFEITTNNLGVGVSPVADPEPELEPEFEIEQELTQEEDSQEIMMEESDEQTPLEEVLAGQAQASKDASPIAENTIANEQIEQIAQQDLDRAEVIDLVVEEESEAVSGFAMSDYATLVQHVAGGGDLSIPDFHQLVVSTTPLTLNQFGEWDESSIDNGLGFHQVVIGSSAIATTSLSVGYVIWMLRGGSLLVSLVSTLPAWSSFDPLPILNKFDEEDKESLADIAGN